MNHPSNRTTDPLRVGQIGVGHFGKQRRIWMKQTGLFRIDVLYDWDATVCQTAAREEQALAAESYQQLLDHPGLEAVIICTGAKYHAEHVMAALRRGLHVFVEKPLCSSLADLQTLLEAAEQSSSLVAVGHHDHDHDPYVQHLRRMMDTGELGRPVYFEKTTGHPAGLHMRPDEWRADAANNPGGMLFQCGVHGIHELRALFGQVVSVDCMMRSDAHTTPTVDVALCQLAFDSGVIGTLNAFHVCPYRHYLYVYGTKANVYREDLYYPRRRQVHRQKTQLDHGPEPWEPITLPEHNDPTLELVNFHRSVRQGVAIKPSLVDGAWAVAVVFAAELAAREGRRVVLTDLPVVQQLLRLSPSPELDPVMEKP